MAHKHKIKVSFRRVRGDRYTPYKAGVPGCPECDRAAEIANAALKQAAQDNFVKRGLH